MVVELFVKIILFRSAMVIFSISSLDFRTVKLVVLRCLVMLIFMTSCNNNRNNVRSNPATPAIKLLSSIKQDVNGIKIDTEVILTDKNLKPLIAELAKSPIRSSYVVTDIPDFIKSFLDKVCSDRFSIANPGKNWNCCDGSWDDKLPNRELNYWGINKDFFFIYYKTGGFGVGGRLILLKYQNKKVNDLWAGAIPLDLKSNEAIANFLEENKSIPKSTYGTMSGI